MLSVQFIKWKNYNQFNRTKKSQHSPARAVLISIKFFENNSKIKNNLWPQYSFIRKTLSPKRWSNKNINSNNKIIESFNDSRLISSPNASSSIVSKLWQYVKCCMKIDIPLCDQLCQSKTGPTLRFLVKRKPLSELESPEPLCP